MIAGSETFLTTQATLSAVGPYDELPARAGSRRAGPGRFPEPPRESATNQDIEQLRIRELSARLAFEWTLIGGKRPRWLPFRTPDDG